MTGSARRLTILAVSVTLGTGCARSDREAISGDGLPQPSDAVWTQQTAWSLSRDPVLEIKGSGEIVEEVPLDPVRVFRTPDGRYAVGDGDQNGWHGLLVYDRRGKFVAQYGREGRGPGEFVQLFTWAGNYRGDSLAAYDFVDRALEIFSSDGKFARRLALPRNRPEERPPRGTSGYSDIFVGPFADGSVLRFEATNITLPDGEGLAWYEPELTVYDPDGVNPLSLGRHRTWAWWWNGKSSGDYPFQPAAHVASGRNVWYYGTADSFVVRVISTTGQVQRTLRRAFARQPVTDQDREDYITWTVDRLKSGWEGSSAMAARAEQRLRSETRFAPYKPAFSNLIEDSEGNLWIEHFRWVGDEQAPNPQPTSWTVFDAKGRFLGEVQVPAGFIISSITNDQVLGIWQDDLDVQHVRVYGLIKPGSPQP